MNDRLSTPSVQCALLLLASLVVNRSAAAAAPERLEDLNDFVAFHCVDCHSAEDPAAGLTLGEGQLNGIAEHAAVWERVVRKLQARQMPPASVSRPDEREYRQAVETLVSELDAAAVARPQPGRTETFRRMTRTEYGHAIRDLLDLEVDPAAWLPADEGSHGFDNITVGKLSPTLLNRYIVAAENISRLAMGRARATGDGKTVRIKPDITQEERIAGLPLGTRGGALVQYNFPQDGLYEISVRLTRDRDEHVEGLREPHELEMLLDLERVASFTVIPPEGGGTWSDKPARHANVDQHLRARIPVTAGPHELAVTFPKQSSSLLETKRQPLNVHFNMYRHPRLTPAIFQVSIAGPFESAGPGETPSRRRVLIRRPQGADDELACATEILTALMRRAYRRPVTKDDLERPLELFRRAGGFETGIEMALSAVLVSPHFLFRIEQDPLEVEPASPYRLDDLQLASRLSFFLWSSIPDEELLDAAVAGRLSDPEVLAQQTLRMLADDRAQSLVTNFAGQWFHLRNLDSVTPDMRLFPDFDDNLRQAFRQETEMLFASVLREDRSVLDLLRTDYTFLNERLAKHYGIPHVYGTRFRRVALTPESRRGGILRHGSLLTVTSYATRTSPVLRGKWILENLLGTPPPPPPSNVPPLKDNTVASNLSVRQRLAAHRENPACSGCHDVIDPIGFSLENFDAVGRWRETEDGQPVDATGGLPDGTEFDGIAGLEQGLLDRPQMFVGTMTEKLLTYAVGRGVEHFDAPAVRKIVKESAGEDYCFSSLVLGIVSSTPFQMRTSAE